MFDLFSKRQKLKRGEGPPDVFQYKDLPRKFRVQVVHILRDALGVPDHYHNQPRAYQIIHDALCREYGLFALTEDAQKGQFHASVFNFLLEVKDHEQALDLIELAFRYISAFDGTEHISELNSRFLEHGIGYQFESNEIVRVDSKLIHSEVVRPVLILLSDQQYSGANQEFLSAHEHYRKGRYKECLNECLKSFESTMKAICKKRKWAYTDGDTAKKLIEICFQKELVPTYLQTHFTSLRSGLESGVPTVRNKLSGHGQGQQPTDVPSYMAAYLLHLTGTSILFMVDAEKNLP